jgi:predicted membrane protein
VTAKLLDAGASPPAATAIRPLSLAVALAIMVAGSVYPFMFAGQGGGVDHGFAFAVFGAMSAGLVNGVGFKPQFVVWRWLFSGWACCFALLLSVWLRWG